MHVKHVFAIPFLLILLTTLPSFAQNKELQVLQMPYEALADRGTPTVIYGKYFERDSAYKVDLPFAFSFNTQSYTTVWVSSRGKIALADPALGYPYPVISAMDANLQGSLGNASETVLSYMQMGDAPERIVIFEWKAFYFQELEGVFDQVNFQIWLYEKDGKIEYHYGYKDVEIIYYRYLEDTLGHFGGYVGLGDQTADHTYDGFWIYGDSSAPQIIPHIPDTDYRQGRYRLGIPRDSTVFVITEQDPLSTSPGASSTDIRFAHPTTKEIVITVAPYEQWGYLFLYDIAGNMIEKIRIQQHTITIPLRHLPPGIYQVSIPRSSGWVWTRKFYIASE